MWTFGHRISVVFQSVGSRHFGTWSRSRRFSPVNPSSVLVFRQQFGPQNSGQFSRNPCSLMKRLFTSTNSTSTPSTRVSVDNRSALSTSSPCSTLFQQLTSNCTSRRSFGDKSEVIEEKSLLKEVSNMAPTGKPVTSSREALDHVKQLVDAQQVLVFSKTWCPFCKKVKDLFTQLKLDNVHYLELDLMSDEEGMLYQEALQSHTGQKTVPNIFVNGRHVGGCDATMKAHAEGQLLGWIRQGRPSASNDTVNNGIDEVMNYDYDLVVIGGGSGGLAASKEAARLGLKVACADFVTPSPMGTTWGLGGTCVNVGCIPKKLMHQAGLLGEALSDSESYGWKVKSSDGSGSGDEGHPTPVVPHDWNTLVEHVQNHIGSLNWGYRVALREKNVTYLNELVKFTGPNCIEGTNKKGQTKAYTSKQFLISVGGRPKYDVVPGIEHCISSDDIFQLPHPPGKTLCVGASYISLECAGFLHGLGFETTVMVRSILLRGFDQQMADLIGEHMEAKGIKFLRGWVLESIEKIREGVDGQPPLLRVTAKDANDSGEKFQLDVNTVLIAIGREPCTSNLGLEHAGVQINSKTGKILTDDAETTSNPSVFAIGDVAEGRPELTPVAIQAGVLLARRLAGVSKTLVDYLKIPTTVFTPIEYGTCGLSEEDAKNYYGEEDIEVYHSNFTALEATLPKRDENGGYVKIICKKSDNDRIVGFHYLGPSAGEVTQGFALAMRLNATKSDMDAVIGIHPTCAEIFTTLEVTKASGASALKKGC